MPLAGFYLLEGASETSGTVVRAQDRELEFFQINPSLTGASFIASQGLDFAVCTMGCLITVGF